MLFFKIYLPSNARLLCTVWKLVSTLD